MPFDVGEVHLALNNSTRGSNAPQVGLFEGSYSRCSGVQIAKIYKGARALKDESKHPTK